LTQHLPLSESRIEKQISAIHRLVAAKLVAIVTDTQTAQLVVFDDVALRQRCGEK